MVRAPGVRQAGIGRHCGRKLWRPHRAHQPCTLPHPARFGGRLLRGYRVSLADTGERQKTHGISGEKTRGYITDLLGGENMPHATMTTKNVQPE